MAKFNVFMEVWKDAGNWGYNGDMFLKSYSVFVKCDNIDNAFKEAIKKVPFSFPHPELYIGEIRVKEVR